MSVQLASIALVVGLSGALPFGQAWKNQPPETFTANAQVTVAEKAAAAVINIQIDRYTDDADRQDVLDALTHGGYPAFLTALRKARAVGSVQMGDRKITVRWARADATEKGGRRLVVVTDAPIYFLGAGAPNAKPTAGYEVGVIEFEVDSVGLGSGRMAAAARVKPGGPTGVQIDDYAQAPIKLVSVTRSIDGTKR